MVSFECIEKAFEEKKYKSTKVQQKNTVLRATGKTDVNAKKVLERFAQCYQRSALVSGYYQLKFCEYVCPLISGR